MMLMKVFILIFKRKIKESSIELITKFRVSSELAPISQTIRGETYNRKSVDFSSNTIEVNDKEFEVFT